MKGDDVLEGYHTASVRLMDLDFRDEPMVHAEPVGKLVRGSRARVLTEDEVFGFYVDLEEPDDYEDSPDFACHDLPHLGGVPLDDVTREGLVEKESVVMRSVASTDVATPQSSSDDDWIPGDGPNAIVEKLVVTDGCVDYLDKHGEERERQRSRSEPRISLCTEVPRPSRRGRDSMCAEQYGARGQRRQRRGWGSRTVLDTKPNLKSCTSTKTFEVLPGEGSGEALTRMRIPPDSMTSCALPRMVTFTLHIARHRVVSAGFGRHAEFEVKLLGGNKSWVAWQRFSEFKLLAACVDKSKTAAKAWQNVKRVQPRFRCLDAIYLSRKCRLLEMFLQQVMFAIPTPTLETAVWGL
ncbi:unnamed protein product [Discosporangium mesarthrocarpum]